MKRWQKVTLGVLTLGLLGGGGLLALLLYLGLPTSGPRIGRYASPRAAVLVIDLQEDFTGPAARRPYRDGDRIVAVANSLLAQAEAHGALVVYIANVVENRVTRAFMGGVNAPGAPGTELDRRLVKVPGGRTFTKGRGDALSNPELDAYLRAQQVDRLLIVGLDGAHCVNSTARGALNRGYQVTMLTDGIATESRTSIDELAAKWRRAGAIVATRMEW
jgi:nicotinamidase-related amidase